ncbi:MAG: divergent PAP2 family protein [Clostridia bacterium]
MSGLYNAAAHAVMSSNRMLVLAITASLSAQILKVPAHYMFRRKWDWGRAVGAGGMPSSHSAMVTSLATAVGYVEGWHSALFAIVTVFALIVLYDAVGIRQAVGRQGRFLNEMQREPEWGDWPRAHLPELVGHTPAEVLAGAVWGILLTIVFY